MAKEIGSFENSDHKLVICWNCQGVIDTDRADFCNCDGEKIDATLKCPYCGKCLHDHPNFEDLIMVDDEAGTHLKGSLVKTIN